MSRRPAAAVPMSRSTKRAEQGVDVLTFPTVLQAKTYDCSAACAKAVEQHYGTTRPLAFYVTGLAVDSANGCDPRTLDRFFRRRGYGVIAGEMTVDDLRFHTSRDRPVVVPVTFDGAGHYVVVYRVARDRVRIADPWCGSVSLRREAFESAWRDHDAVETFRRWGIAVWVLP